MSRPTRVADEPTGTRLRTPRELYPLIKQDGSFRGGGYSETPDSITLWNKSPETSVDWTKGTAARYEQYRELEEAFIRDKIDIHHPTGVLQPRPRSKVQPYASTRPRSSPFHRS